MTTSTQLAKRSCEACRADSKAVVGDERTRLLGALDGWRVVEDHGVAQLERSYLFKNFVHALAFTNAVGALAEAEDHHPSVTTEWGQVTVRWWTHTIRGLHMNDFILAARCDGQYAKASGKKSG